MPHENRIEQLEDLKNIETNADFYEKLAAGSIAVGPSPSSSLSNGNGNTSQQPYYIPVPITIKSQLGSPVSDVCQIMRFMLMQQADCSSDWSILNNTLDSWNGSHGLPWR